MNTRLAREPDYSGKKGMAVTQTLLLILGIMAFGFIIGSEIKVVSAGDDDRSCREGDYGVGICIDRSKCDRNLLVEVYVEVKMRHAVIH